MRKHILLPVCILALSACAPQNFESLQQIASTTSQSVGCGNFESKSWDAINNFLIESKSIPDSEQLKQYLKTTLKDVQSSEGTLSEEQVDSIAKEIGALYDLLLVEAAQKENVQTPAELLSVLSALELGDHTTATKVELQSKVQAQFQKIKAQVESYGVQCSNPAVENEEEAQDPRLEVTASNLPKALFGASLTMATAYQTCQALTEPIMTASTPDAQGISIVGNNGAGKKRVVANVSALLKTHPYYKNVNSYGASCVNMRATPLIYDYGGKPYVSTAAGSPFNLFKDAGGGTKVLGIDCSGFVYTSLATAGLRLSPSKNMKATGVYGINALMYVEPQYNSMTCLQKVTVKPTETIKSGDIFAIDGHVLMIDTVRNDPFGLNTAKTVNDCSNMSYKNFNFAVIQSSNSKDGIGINRYEAKHYFGESPTMRKGLERYAYYSCLARFNNKSYTPNLGTSSLVRHKGTPECLGTRIALSQESCVKSCPQLAQ